MGLLSGSHSRVSTMTDFAVIMCLSTSSRTVPQPSSTSWAVTFTIIMITVLSLGFGPIGVVAGSTAAAFQAWMYGGFTPGAGIFATLTSLGMLGLMMPAAVTFAACIATVVAWAYGVGA